MEKTENKNRGKLALCLSLSGLFIFVILFFAVNFVTPQSQFSFLMISYCIFLCFQISAFVFGILSRHDKFGKAGYLISLILTVVSFLTT